MPIDPRANATRHPIEKVKTSPFAIAKCSDFALLSGEVVSAPLKASYLPYQYSPETDEYYLVDTPTSACHEPFLYLAQYSCATHVVRVRRKSLADYVPDLDQWASCRPTLIFSIGRSGSTLLSRLFSAFGYSCFSESDVFTRLPRIQDPGTRRQVIRDTIGMLAAYGGDPRSDDVVVKMRAQCNASLIDIRDALPDASYVFVARELRAWVRSFLGKFDISHDDLGAILKSFVAGLKFMQERAYPHVLLRYEGFQGWPETLLPLLYRTSDDREAFARRAAAVMSRDSQEGAGIADRMPAALLTRKCDEFLKLWEGARPAQDIERLGLDL